jgi:hypothetical protein
MALLQQIMHFVGARGLVKGCVLRPLSTQLNAEHWSAIFGNAEFCKEVLVVPLQESAIRLAQTVTEWRCKMRPHDNDAARARIVNE